MRRRFVKSVVRSNGLTVELPLILMDLSVLGVSGMSGVVVRCVGVVWKAGAEGGSLGHN